MTKEIYTDQRENSIEKFNNIIYTSYNDIANNILINLKIKIFINYTFTKQFLILHIFLKHIKHFVNKI
ncbi:hypothetical protein HERIO_539 [Hepatospora eriocheir]|uniref:Uncharacterized protein n=1 Tax=Hepatospora eriocheir TaxID=1081669 RepID=A0A1X0QCR1_9MICR|nr:hypothetical protein HERIO_539 [Hepatospora eriocheir]